MEIKITYSTVDRFVKVGRYKTLKGAQAFAHKWVGEHPEMGSTYAVSGDGVGKVTVTGCTLKELFSPLPKFAKVNGHNVAIPEGFKAVDGGKGPGAYDYVSYRGIEIHTMELNDDEQEPKVYTGPFVVSDWNELVELKSLADAKDYIDKIKLAED